MPTYMVIVIVFIVVATDVILIGSLREIVKQKFVTLARDFPAKPPREGAIRKEFQSVQIDWFSFGFCVHLTVDEDCLHMDPAWLARVFAGKSISVPWESVELIKPGKGRCKAKIGKVKIEGPTWALSLAATPEESDDSLSG